MLDGDAEERPTRGPFVPTCLGRLEGGAVELATGARVTEDAGDPCEADESPGEGRVAARREGDGTFEPVAPLADVAVEPPVETERRGQAEQLRMRPARLGPGQCGSQVLDVRSQAPGRGGMPGPVERAASFLRERQVVGEVPVAQDRLVLEVLPGVLPDRLEHREPRRPIDIGDAHEAVVDEHRERLEQLVLAVHDPGRRDRVGRREVEATPEDAQAPEERRLTR